MACGPVGQTVSALLDEWLAHIEHLGRSPSTMYNYGRLVRQLPDGGVPAQIPCLLLARLAVDRSEQNRKVGKGLLVDAIRRAVRVSEDVGVRALLIHARDEDARAYYEHQAEFVRSPTDPLHLFLQLKHARSLMP